MINTLILNDNVYELWALDGTSDTYRIAQQKPYPIEHWEEPLQPSTGDGLKYYFYRAIKIDGKYYGLKLITTPQ